MIKEKIEEWARKTLGRNSDFTLVRPKDFKNGDFSLIVPDTTSEKDFKSLDKNKIAEISKIDFIKPRFINFYLSKEFFKNSLGEIIKKGDKFGKNKNLEGEKVVIEYTDPNPFKEFHIGHLMSNTIGEAVSRIIEWNGAEVKRACYQGDVGLHVAKAIWAQGDYAKGARAYEASKTAKKEIEEINKTIYAKSDPELNARYEKGKKESLEKFKEIYKRLGTKFDYYFFESETGDIGKKVVLDNVGKVFEKSQGAIVFKGSHTRVFVNSQGLPTYESKDLGNAKIKYDKYPYTKSIIITGNEIKDYFKVVLEAMGKVIPELSEKTKHLPHGMLRLPTGKMSSRTGDVIAAEALIEEVKEKVKGNEKVAIGAIKYMILRQAIGNDIIFDIEKSVSTEGDSGAYLQYAYARTNSLLRLMDFSGLVLWTGSNDIRLIERLLYRFPEIVERAGKEYAPHYITTYLTELAASFNNFYAHEQVISNEPESPYRLAIVRAFKTVMKNGLNILGIPAPERM